jgi:hypothetical protein
LVKDFGRCGNSQRGLWFGENAFVAITYRRIMHDGLQYSWALARMPENALLHLRYGMFLFADDRNAAGEQFPLAEPWDGLPVFLPDGTQVR